MHQGSLKKTVPDACNLIPVRVYGLARVFNLASRGRFDDDSKRPVCVLNVHETDAAKGMNGVCFEMSESAMQDLLQRESGYEIRKITVHDYLNRGHKFDACYFHAQDFEPYEFLSGSRAQRHYLDLCLSASRYYGEDFLSEFICSTSFWGIDNDADRQSIWNGEY